MEARVVLAGEQFARHHGLGGLVNDGAKPIQVQVAPGRGHDTEALGTLHVCAHEQSELLRGIQERVNREHFLVIALGDEVHLHVSAALDEKCL